MAYVRPEDVTSPQQHWRLIEVLDEGDEGTTALALGRWVGERKRGQPSRPVLAMRWNGFNEPRDDETRAGNPSSRGYPTWFIVEEKYYDAILSSGLLSPDKVALARRYFPTK